ncbi:MAG: 50S ribosome-binding GTPase [Firmicutes bacterium]|nr:50S ribosome-binding GTPase [Bacillota bacterium]
MTGYKKVEQAIINDSALSHEEQQKALANLAKYRDKKANILIIGATGAGKSSTINAMFNMEVAKVGVGVGPETMQIKKFELDNLTLWDSPGLGDSSENDEQHKRNIIDLLAKKDENGNLLVDVVLLLLDGKSKDLGTSYELVTNVIIPCIGEHKRLLIGINQVDALLNGKYWDYQNNKPLAPLQEKINEKVKSISERIFETTGVKVTPIAYSAGYKESGQSQEKSYNVSTLLCHLIDKIPEEKRVSVVSNSNETSWSRDDDGGSIFGFPGLLVGGAAFLALDGLETVTDFGFDVLDTATDVVFDVADTAVDIVSDTFEFVGDIIGSLFDW